MTNSIFTFTSTGISAGSDRKSTRLNSSHVEISYAVFCLKKKKQQILTVQHQNIHLVHHQLQHQDLHADVQHGDDEHHHNCHAREPMPNSSKHQSVSIQMF